MLEMNFLAQSASFPQEASSQGQRIHWLDVYVAALDGLPEAIQIAETYSTLMDERYPEGIPRLPIDQELWERVSVVKKHYVNGQGQRRRPTISGTSSSSSQSTQSSCHPMPHTTADCVRAICRDHDLLRTLCVHLQSLEPDELAEAVATAAQQETDDLARLDDNVRTRYVFDVALKVHQNIQQRDIEVGRNLGNRILRHLDRMKPSAHIRGEPPGKLPPSNNVNKQMLKPGEVPGTARPNSKMVDRESNGPHLFSLPVNIRPKYFPTLGIMMRPSKPASMIGHRHFDPQQLYPTQTTESADLKVYFERI